jgi:hypothetical protein
VEIPAITVVERGTVPRKFRAAHNAATRDGYRAAGVVFHETLAPQRFTVAHGRRAGFRPRSGSQFAFGTKAFWRSYAGRKQSRGVPQPLVWSGRTRDRAKAVRVAVTGRGASLRYSLPALNWLPWTRAEFSMVLPAEAEQLGRDFKRGYDVRFNNFSDGDGGG